VRAGPAIQLLSLGQAVYKQSRLKLKAALFNCYRELGNGQITDTGDIKANDSTAIELPTTVEYDFLWNLVKDIGSDWDIDYRFEVGVQFKLPIVGKFTLPLHHSGTVKLPTFSDMF
jgi:hypothetical protein